MAGKDTKDKSKPRASRRDASKESPKKRPTASDASPRKRGKSKSPTRANPKDGKSTVRKRLAGNQTPPRSPARGRPPKSVTAATPTKSARRSPGRKSPSRQEKDENYMPTGRVPHFVVVDSDSDSDTGMLTRSKRTASKEPSIEATTGTSYLRSRAMKDANERVPVVYLTQANINPMKKLTEFSDEDETPIAVKHAAPASSKRLQLGSIIATLLYCVVELVLTYAIPVLCTETKCEWRWFNRKDMDCVRSSFNLAILLTLAAFVLLNGIISIVPIGGKRCTSMVPLDKFDYVMNALFALVLQVAALVALEVYHIPATLYAINNYFKLITAAAVLSVGIGVILFVKGLYAKRMLSKTHLDHFVLGSEVNPRFGPMDVKFVLIRTCTLGTILFILSLTYQSTEMISTTPMEMKEGISANWMHLLQSVRIRPTLCVFCTLVLIYYTDQFIFENTLLSTMEFRATPFGYLKTHEYLAGLFIFAGAPKYVYDYNVELQTWELAVCTAVFLMGYGLYRGANSQKHAFRENPYSPLSSKYESIPTNMGKRILCSGYWGIVRHPNYLGDILLNAALVRFVWPSPIVLVFAFIFAHLVARAYHDNKKCRQRYGAAWERYCQRVPKLLIPKLF